MTSWKKVDRMAAENKRPIQQRTKGLYPFLGLRLAVYIHFHLVDTGPKQY